MAFIYKITNLINGKVYIGKTTKADPYDRFKEHKNDHKKERCKNRPLYRAMNKYGVENFEFVVIEHIENSKDACEREKYWIEHYDTYRKGYNATKGGDGKEYLNLNEKDVINFFKSNGEIIAHTAKKFNASDRTIKEILKKNNIKTRTLEEIAVLNGRTRYKPIYKISKNGEKVLYDSVSDACRSLGAVEKLDIVHKAKCITDSIKRNGYSYGYKWEYA